LAIALNAGVHARAAASRQLLRGSEDLLNTPAMTAFFQASFFWCLVPYLAYIMEGR